jgi:hypothetical protein
VTIRGRDESREGLRRVPLDGGGSLRSKFRCPQAKLLLRVAAPHVEGVNMGGLLIAEAWRRGSVPLPHRLSPEAGSMDRGVRVGREEEGMVRVLPTLLPKRRNAVFANHPTLRPKVSRS